MLLTGLEYRVTHFMTGIGAPSGAAVVYGLLGSGAAPTVAMANGIHDAFCDNLTPQMDGGITITQTLVKQGPDETGPSVLYGESDTGTLVGNGAPPNISYLIHKNTFGGGRRGRGRMFLPGVVEGDVDESGIISAARVAALQVAINAFQVAVIALPDIDNVGLEHEPPTEWSLVNGQPRRVPTGAAPPMSLVASFTVDVKVATQRRRLRR